jgi:hypothetical protein
MMSESIKEMLLRHPFEPFVIRTSGGQAYRVSSPDLIVLMKTKVFIAEPRSDHAATVSYLHITAVEESDSGSGGTGRRRRRAG